MKDVAFLERLARDEDANPNDPDRRVHPAAIDALIEAGSAKHGGIDTGPVADAADAALERLGIVDDGQDDD